MSEEELAELIAIWVDDFRLKVSDEAQDALIGRIVDACGLDPQDSH